MSTLCVQKGSVTNNPAYENQPTCLYSLDEVGYIYTSVRFMPWRNVFLKKWSYILGRINTFWMDVVLVWFMCCRSRRIKGKETGACVHAIYIRPHLCFPLLWERRREEVFSVRISAGNWRYTVPQLLFRRPDGKAKMINVKAAWNLERTVGSIGNQEHGDMKICHMCT